MPVGWKLLAVLVGAVVILAVDSPLWLVVMLGIVAAGYVLGRIPLGACWRLVRLAVPVAVLLFVAQWLLRDLTTASVLGLRVLAALGIAHLFTLTTSVEALISTMERGLTPLARVPGLRWVRPERVGLLVGLSVQAIATLGTLARATREAQLARNAGASPRAFAVPFLVRTLRHSDELGEALAARGLGEEE